MRRGRNSEAPQGPSVSSRRFQPAESEAEEITSTPTGLTYSSAPPGPALFFLFLSVGFTHGYSRFAPFGATPTLLYA
jgi:hypothetical protein